MGDGPAGMPAGAGLASALHAVPFAAVPNDRMLELARAQYRQLCHEQARMAAVLVELARRDGVPSPGAVSRTVGADPYAVHETRAALRWTRSAAEAEHAMAEFVLGELPAVFDAWLAGEIDRPRVRVFEQYLYGLAADQIAAVCAVAVPRAPSMTTGQLTALLRRMVIAVDPSAADRWYRHRVRERGVCAYLAPDGTVTVSGHGLPADDAEVACQRVERLAAATRRAGHPGTVGQIRADVFLALLDGRYHGMDTDQLVTALIADHNRAVTDELANLVNTAGDGGAANPADGSTPATGAGDGADPAHGEGADPAGHATDSPGHHGNGLGRLGAPDGQGSRSDRADGRRPGSGRADGSAAADRRGATGGRGDPTDQRRGIEIRVELSTLLGLDDHPGEIPGLGPVPAPVARARVALQSRAEWRFAVVDEDGGLSCEGLTRRRPAGALRAGCPPGGIVELHVSPELLSRLAADPALAGAWAAVVDDIAAQYRDRDRHVVDLDARPDDRLPSAALRRHTEIRDRTCNFAGVCRRPAHAGHQDHRRDHALGGATVVDNLGPTCPQDHAIKHRAGWIVTSTASGHTTWHSPLGGAYPTRGEFLCSELPEPVPQPDPHSEAPPRRVVDEPILRRPPPSRTEPTTPPTKPGDDGPPF